MAKLEALSAKQAAEQAVVALPEVVKKRAAPRSCAAFLKLGRSGRANIIDARIVNAGPLKRQHRDAYVLTFQFGYL